MNWKAHFGLDGFDVVVHVVATAMLMAVVTGFIHGPEADPILAGIVGASVVVLSIRRRRALSAGAAAGDEVSSRLGELEERMGELEVAHQRIYELEERLDFAERLLMQQREQDPGRLKAGEQGART